MTIRVITAPEPIITPQDIPGDHHHDDPEITAMIAASQEMIDGPTGWLGRALGPQELEYSGSFSCRRVQLPFFPVIEIVKIICRDADGAERDVDPATYRLEGDDLVIKQGADWAATSRHIIRYRAGCDGYDVADGGTGQVPQRARQAIRLMVKSQLDLIGKDSFLTQESVVGVSTMTRNVNPQAVLAITDATKSLLAGLRVYA